MARSGDGRDPSACAADTIGIHPAHVDGSPFVLRAGAAGCLLLHGLTATAQEMRYLGERLQTQDFTVSGPLLAGHGTAVTDLAACSWKDWYSSSAAGLQRLDTHAPHVVVGQSMGALLAITLAAAYPTAIVGAVLLSPALQLSDRRIQRWAPLLPLILPLLPQRRRYIAKGERDIADPQARVESPSYRQIPLRAVYELTRLQRHVRRALPAVRQPVLIIHSRQDHTCPLDNVAALQRRLPGPVQVLVLDHSYHVVSVDVERDRVAGAVAAFATECIGGASAGSGVPVREDVGLEPIDAGRSTKTVRL